MRYNTAVSLLLLCVAAALAGCVNQDAQRASKDPYAPTPYVKISHPEWSKNASIYQLNTRQFSAECTFRTAEVQLPRLKALGVDIIWLMPIHPIGEQNR